MGQQIVEQKSGHHDQAAQIKHPQDALHASLPELDPCETSAARARAKMLGSAPPMSILDDLAWRGQLYQSTDLEQLKQHLATGSRSLYCGFDPTKDSLGIGNLVPMLVLRRFQLAGHKPV